MNKKLSIPQVCMNMSCGYYGNINSTKCPVCGANMYIPSDGVSKMFNRIARYTRMKGQVSMPFVLGREKTMIYNAAQEIIAEDPNIPMIEL